MAELIPNGGIWPYGVFSEVAAAARRRVLPGVPASPFDAGRHRRLEGTVDDSYSIGILLISENIWSLPVGSAPEAGSANVHKRGRQKRIKEKTS